MRWIWAVITCFILVACSNTPNTEARFSDVLLAAAKNRIAAVAPTSQGGATPAVPVTRAAALAQTPGPVMFVTLPRLNARASVVPQGENANVQTWFSSDGISLALRDGVLVGTRGFGPDLMSVELGAVNQVLGRGKTPQEPAYGKRYFYLNGEDQTVSLTVDCQLQEKARDVITARQTQYRARHFQESCQGAGGAIRFENQYWVKGGEVLKSTQWIGPVLGMIQLEVLR